MLTYEVQWGSLYLLEPLVIEPWNLLLLVAQSYFYVSYYKRKDIREPDVGVIQGQKFLDSEIGKSWTVYLQWRISNFSNWRGLLGG